MIGEEEEHRIAVVGEEADEVEVGSTLTHIVRIANIGNQMINRTKNKGKGERKGP